ncbi:hypothetical protein [Gordonia otitidis]|nr:hypothetical protein [Gordonia otitidis]
MPTEPTRGPINGGCSREFRDNVHAARSAVDLPHKALPLTG